MAARGGQLGNQNASRGHRWRDAIEAALDRAGNAEGSRAGMVAALGKLADKLVADALAGNVEARTEIANRLDGKPAVIIGGNDETGPIAITLSRTASSV
jgi:hypothetical protein